MKLKLEVTEQDFVRAHFLHMRPRTWIKIAGILFIAIVFICLLASLYQAVFRHEPFAIPLFFICLVAFYIWFFSYSLPKGFRKLYRQQKYHPVSDCEVNDTTLSISNSIENSKFPWDYFRKWRENRYVFILYPVDHLFHIFPKHCFSSEQDLEDFKKLLTEKLGQEK